MNKMIADKKDINRKIFWNYFDYQSPSFLAKYLLKAKQANNQQSVNHINDSLIDLRNVANKKNILKMKILKR